MSQMRKPVMEVIRFRGSDIVVASNGSRRATTPSLTLTGFNGKKPADGVANLNGVNYSISSFDDVNTFLGALGNSGVKNAGIYAGTTENALTFRGVLRTEANTGANGWDGNYYYDPDAIWNNGDKDFKGVFKRQ